ncbi:zinc-ribbon domain-containing protein [uncultured Tateyamaria sp.]|uniref:zinc-ribbon domain-containing protein n=1 Tax=uncultured Tateyamaria sp. TaxID=455651 RepID=UPI002632A7C8|nr:zinc-ribbon domain-containing protein [uncultured Tateyamaria sp.]
MRLICPNCDAQYEVVDDVIPTEGRDVQCSNCGQTWFQHHPDHAPADPEEVDGPEDLAPVEDTPGPDEERAPAPEPQRRELDPSVADILREEAEIEAQARAADADVLESQPDLGLESGETDADRRAREARDRMARMRGESAEPPEQVSEAVATAAAIGSRRDLLPDIEEINSTLRSTGDRQSGPGNETSVDATEAAPRKSGFRRGFTLMVLLAVILGAIYVFAPDIARSVPQADPFLSAYVAQVDAARLWLDGQVAAGLTWLDNLTAPEGE